jgi:hypothetical protein
VVQVVTSLSLSQSSFTAGDLGGDSARLLSADLRDGWAAQYGAHASTAPVIPTINMGASDTWVSAAVLLKAGQTGGVPNGLRIVHLLHENIAYHTSSGGTGNPFPVPLPLQFPSTGNLLVAMIGGGNGPETVTGMTDSHQNAWQQAGETYMQADATVQTYFAGSATTSEDLALSSSWGGGPGDYTFFLYDIAGAAADPLDTTAGGGDYQGNAGSLTMPFTITPSIPTEIVFSEVMWDFNTGSGLQGQLFDTNTFTGESVSGPEPVDENNGWGHVITTTTDPVSFTWSVLFPGVPVGNWAGMVAAFKGAP